MIDSPNPMRHLTFFSIHLRQELILENSAKYLLGLSDFQLLQVWQRGLMTCLTLLHLHLNLLIKLS